MCLSLCDYKFKATRYRNVLIYFKKKVTTNQKHTIDSQKPKRREHKCNIKENHHTTKVKTKGKERNNKKENINWKTRFKMAINTYLSIITLNVNETNAPIKKLRVADWLKRQEPTICCLQETYLIEQKNTHMSKVKGWKKAFNANRNDKKVGVAILI